MNDTRISFPAILAFFDDADRQRRMIESEIHHQRPALAGIVLELEEREDVRQLFRNYPSDTSTRFRQAIGVVVRIVMEAQGWRRTGRKGSLGLAVVFKRAERFELPNGMPYAPFKERYAAWRRASNQDLEL